MSLSSKDPGVALGWRSKGPKGCRRLKRTAKKFQRRLRRRTLTVPSET